MGQFEGLKDFDVAALGRNASATTGKPRDLPVARIERDPDNIRKSFDEAAVIQLAETIKADGLLQAITVRRNVPQEGLLSHQLWRAPVPRRVPAGTPHHRCRDR